MDKGESVLTSLLIRVTVNLKIVVFNKDVEN